MKTMISAVALTAALAISGAAFAQAPTGGADAKGNAPLKAPHTVNDGGAKRGATSFTEGEARKHIEHAGYGAVSPLVKGDDGVWRGTAMKNGASVQVGLDFKGNVVEAGPGASGPTRSEGSSVSRTVTTRDAGARSTVDAQGVASTTAVTTKTAAGGRPHRRHHRHHRHHLRTACADPGPNGAACSGVDRNKNGVSDKEDRAIKAGARP